MSLVAQRIAHLLNGVSQKPQEQRLSSQVTEQTNGLSHPVRGLMKRPPLTYLGKLTATITGWTNAFTHSINRDANERYHVAIANGEVKAYNALTGTSVTVLAPGGTAYLADGGNAGFRAATAGDTTVIVNRGKIIKRGNTKTSGASFEALVYIRQADFGTIYQVTLNDVAVAIRTIAGSTASSREELSTENIATDLFTALDDAVLLNAFTFTRYGSTIHITNTVDFKLSVFDGLSDKGLKAVKGEVQAFVDLPRKAPNGFIVQVSGDPESNLDDYYVKFDDAGKPSQEGVWRECPAPGTLIDLDASTMPHRLVRQGHVLQDAVHVNPVTLPTLGSTLVDTTGLSVLTKYWSTTEPGAVSIPAGTTVTLRNHGTSVKVTTGQTAYDLSGGYSLDCGLVEVGNDVTVTLTINSVTKYTKLHPAGKGTLFLATISDALDPRPAAISKGFFWIKESLGAADVVELKLTYAKGSTPDQYRQAYLTPGNIKLIGTTQREIRFSETDLYPIGSTVTVTVDAIPFAHTVITTAKTGTQIAATMQGLIDAHATFIASLGSPTSRVKVSRTDAVYPLITVAVTFSNSTIFYNPTLAMVTNEHAGRTLRNLTDGSSGTVQSNDATRVVVDALTGGVNNIFQKGDTISIDGSGTYFVFEPIPWKNRGAGNLTTVPFPSFVDGKISDVVFYSNRLGFTSGENVVFSSSGDLFNFFRYTATQLLADDTIDVRSSHKDVSLFHSLTLWNGGLYGVSNNALWHITGEPAFTPTTIRIDLASLVTNTAGLRPVVNGNRLYLTREKAGFTQVMEFRPSGVNVDQVEFIDVTADAPKYVKGAPVATVGDDSLGIVAVVTNDSGAKNLYVYSYRFDEQGARLQSSWSKWPFSAGQMVGLDIIDGKLGVVTLRGDGVYLEIIDLNVVLDTITLDEGAQYLDRRVSNVTSGVSVAHVAGTTTWTLPFNVATDGSEGTLQVVSRTGAVQVYASTRPAANQIAVSGQGDLSAASVYIGVSYEFRCPLSRIYFRKDEVPETRGRLILRYLDLQYVDSTDFDVEVALQGRSAYTYTTDLALAASGTVRVPIQSKNEYATITLVNNKPGPCAFSSLDWEGDLTLRVQRA